MRIRTEGREHRRRTIEEAAAAWGCNMTRAVLLSCELSTIVLEELPVLLEDPRIPPDVARDLSESLDGPYLDVEYTGPTVELSTSD
jgi:hypothetical protein